LIHHAKAWCFHPKKRVALRAGGMTERGAAFGKAPPRQKKAGWATLSYKFIRNNKLTGWATHKR